MPRIGLISDSHGHAEITRRAAAMLAEAGAQVLLHLGDICSESVIDTLLVSAPGESQPLPVHLVFGNMDFDVAAMGRYARSLGICVDHPVGRLDCGPVSLVFLHGHDQAALIGPLEEQIAYICYGHTHVADDRHRARTRMINPGALSRTAAPSVALLDTEADLLESIAVPP